MSCNGCRVLRKGCSEACILRPCLQWIDGAAAQGHATVFVAKFFGRAGLMSFISAVPQTQRPALFQSLLFEAAGRTVNPVNGAVGLLWTGNWHVCQAAVETVLRGGSLKPIPALGGGGAPPDDASECATDMAQKRRRLTDEVADLGLTPEFRGEKGGGGGSSEMTWRLGSPSWNSEESDTTTCGDRPENRIKLLNLFN